MKFKQISDDYFVTILDRLTRFEPAYIRFERVFNDIINKFCIDIKSKNLSIEEKITLTQQIIDSSTTNHNDYYINDILRDLEDKYFINNEKSYHYLSTRLNICGMLEKIRNFQNLPKNVQWLLEINSNRNDILKLRKQKSLLYPIQKIILCEGQTEFTLLETIFRLFDIDFNKLGLLTIPAGGKNQVARKYYQMIEYTKLPFFILLDKDATSIKDLIRPKLREIDDLYLIKSGEFEDLISKNILQNTINNLHSFDYNCIWDDFNDDLSMVKNLENIYKKYGFGEFKKAKFALNLKQYIEKNVTKDDLIDTEIIDIINVLK